MKQPVNLLETLINRANEYYRTKDIAKVFKSDPPPRLRAKGFVDYFGSVNGRPFAMEAKEIDQNALPMGKIKEHQYDLLNELRCDNWIACLAVHLQPLKRFWIVPFDGHLISYWETRKQLDDETLCRIGREVFTSKIDGYDELLNWIVPLQKIKNYFGDYVDSPEIHQWFRK